MALNTDESIVSLGTTPENGSAVDAVVRQIRGLIAEAGLKVGDNLVEKMQVAIVVRDGVVQSVEGA